jgi:hypothetical protein
MTRAQKRWKAMAAFRGAVKGWAFCPAASLPSYIRRGEAEAALLPDECKAEAEETLQAMRKARMSEEGA